MGAACYDPAALDHQDQVGRADGGQAVGDDEGGAVDQGLSQGLLNGGFRGVVEVGGGLVEDDHVLAGQQQPGMVMRWRSPPERR